MRILIDWPSTRPQGWTHLFLDFCGPERKSYESQSDSVIAIPVLLLIIVADCVALGWDEGKFEDGHDENILAAGNIGPARVLRMRPLLSIE